MPSKPEVTYADLDIALFISASSAEKIQYIYYDGDKEVARFGSAKAGKDWIEESEMMGCDIEFGFEGDFETLTREVEYIDLGVEKAYEVFDQLIDEYKKSAGTPVFKGYVSASTGAEVFRHKVATIKPYKGGRASRKPVHLEAVREYAINHHGFIQTKGSIETDDMTQALAQRADEKGQLLSLDKDSQTCVGCWLLNENYFDKPVFSDPTIVGWLEKSGDHVVGLGNLYLCYMGLVGDVVDAVVGVPRVGKAKAYELLREFSNKPADTLPDALSVVAKEYKKVYGDKHEYKHWKTGEKITRGWYEMMLEQFTLLYMLKGSNDDVEKSILVHLDREKV